MITRVALWFQSWGFFDVNSPESGLLKIAGFNLQGISAGTSGAVVEFHFYRSKREQ